MEKSTLPFSKMQSEISSLGNNLGVFSIKEGRTRSKNLFCISCRLFEVFYTV